MYKLKKITLFVVRTLVVAVVLSAFGDVTLRDQKAHSANYDQLFRKSGISGYGQPHLAPDFTLHDLSGNSVSLSQFRGRMVFLNFWATWCPPCRSEMPAMDALYNRFKGRGLVMLAVDMRESKAPVAKFMNDLQLNFPALLDINGSVSTLYGITGLPTTYIIDPKGNIIGKKVGPKNWATQDVVALFESFLEGKEVSASAVVSTAPVPMPSALLVKSSQVSIYTQQDERSETITKVNRGEKLVPLAKAFGGGSPWYMVKTEKGAVGWIRATEVEEAGQ